jgi:LemA protein
MAAGGHVIALLVVVALVALVVLGFGVYNRLVTRRNACRNAFAQIDVQLKRRHDLVPNLVEAAKGYLAHERATMEAVIAARAAATSASRTLAASPGDPGALRGLAHAEQALSGALSRLLVVAEAYPELKADATIASLVEELTSTENRIGFARQAFNDAVLEYNNARETYPGALLAAGFRAAEPLAATTREERGPVRVAFS